MATATAMATTSILIHSRPPLSTRPSDSKLLLWHHQLLPTRRQVMPFSNKALPSPHRSIAGKEVSVYLRTFSACGASRRNSPTTAADNSAQKGDDENTRRVLQLILWIAEGIYILWLFLLPYAPGDPVWAISSETVNSLVGLSLNFFFILPLMNSETLFAIELFHLMIRYEPNVIE